MAHALGVGYIYSFILNVICYLHYFAHNYELVSSWYLCILGKLAILLGGVYETYYTKVRTAYFSLY